MNRQLMAVYNFKHVQTMYRVPSNLCRVAINFNGYSPIGDRLEEFDTPEKAEQFMISFKDWCFREHTGGCGIYEEEEK